MTTHDPTATGFESPSVEEVSKSFPHLEIVDFIGQGGMGAVYKARQPGLDRLVAVKILPPQIANDPSFSERFSREARALARLNHPNIVAVHEIGQNDGLCYFVMEFVDGTNLREAMLNGDMQPKETLAIVPQICDALQYAHNQGVVHRDIKPENILLDKSGQVKIADFGLSKLLGENQLEGKLTGTNQVMGTLRYMSPEQMEGTHDVDHRADIFSLGVVFYEMLTGELPIGQFQPPSCKVQVDVRLDEVVLRTMAKEPARRYQNASAVKSDIERISQPGGLPLPAVVEPAIGEEIDNSDLGSIPHYGKLILGGVWVGLGITFINRPGAERSPLFLIIGLIIALIGGLNIAGAFSTRIRRDKRPNVGKIVEGSIVIVVGAVLLAFIYVQKHGFFVWFVGNPGIWLGIGLIITGSFVIQAAWPTQKKKTPNDRNNRPLSPKPPLKPSNF